MQWHENISSLKRNQKYDLIILSYVLQEINEPEDICKLINLLYKLLKPNGVFLIVEPGNPKGARYIHDIRKIIIVDRRFPLYKDCIFDADISNANIIAPCSHDGKCPLMNNKFSWCHFSQMGYKWPNDVFVKKSYEHSMFNEKYS